MIWMFLCVTLYALTYQFDEVLEEYRFGAAGWPRFLIIATFMFAAIQFIVSLGKDAEKEAGEQKKIEVKSTDFKSTSKLISNFLLPLLYLFLMPRAGYYVMTFPFLAVYMYVLGAKKWWQLVGISLLIYSVILLLFTKLLFIQLPVGVWPGFYEVNNFILSVVK